MDDLADIRDMYNTGWDIEDSRLRRHQLERDITWLYLDEYLPMRGRILEVGAATGAYTLELARQGYEVLAVDMAEKLVAGAKAKASQAGLSARIEFRVGDARVLEGIPEGAFEGALLMGPLYHLTLREERILAIERVNSCLRSGGILFSSMLSRFGILGDRLKSSPSWIENETEVASVIQRGHRPDDAPRGGFRGYYVTVEEIASLHEQAGFQTIVIAGAEPAISADDESYNSLEGEQQRLWLDLLYKVSAEPSTVASSRHLLYVGRKS